MNAGNDENNDSDRLRRLEQQLEQITGRLAALEQPATRAPAPEATPWVTGPDLGPGGGAGAMPGPAATIPDVADEKAVFSISGHGQFGPNRLVIRQLLRLSEVMDADPDSVARVFTALASPARIILLRALLNGPRNSQELRRDLDDPSAGQLYHHLRELLAAGLVVQPARSVYAIPRSNQMALCIQIAVAARITSENNRYPPPAAEELGEDLPAVPSADEEARPDDGP